MWVAAQEFRWSAMRVRVYKGRSSSGGLGGAMRLKAKRGAGWRAVT